MSNQVLFTAKQSLLKVYVCRDLLTDYEALSNDIPQAQLIARDVVIRGCSPIIPSLYYPQFINPADPDHQVVIKTYMLDLMQVCDYFVIDKNASNSPLAAFQIEAAKNIFPAGAVCESLEDFITTVEGFRQANVQHIMPIEDAVPAEEPSSVAGSDEVAND